MMDKIESKLSSHRRTRVSVDVSERDMERQLFLKRIGWNATRVDRENGEQGEDTYRFVQNVSGIAQEVECL